MLGKVPIDLFHHTQTQLLQQLFVLLLISRKLELLLLSVSSNVLHDQVLQLVSVFQVRILTHNAVNTVSVKVLQKLLKKWSNLGISLVIFLLLLLSLSRLIHLLQKVLIFLLNDHPVSVFIPHTSVRTNHHSLNQIFLQFRQAQNLRNH